MRTMDESCKAAILLSLITPIFRSAGKSIQNYKLLHFFGSLLTSLFLFLLHLLNFLPSPPKYPFKRHNSEYPRPTICTANIAVPVSKDRGSSSNSAIGRSLYQTLTIINNIPVRSEKYNMIRSLAEDIIDDNLRQGSQKLRDVNCQILSAAFVHTLNQLEAIVLDQNEEADSIAQGSSLGLWSRGDYGLGQVLKKVVRYLGCQVAIGFGYGPSGGRKRCGSDGLDHMVELDQNGCQIWADKWAAELLWLAEKLVACSGVNEAVESWAAASNLAWLSLSSSSNRLQGSLVKLTAFLIKQANDIVPLPSLEEETQEQQLRQQKQIKMKFLMSWLPLLCRASNGNDAPILRTIDRTEIEGQLEEMIGTLEEEDQEKVLSLWLHHFIHCSSSVWPNLRGAYHRWYSTSRKLFLMQ